MHGSGDADAGRVCCGMHRRQYLYSVERNSLHPLPDRQRPRRDNPQFSNGNRRTRRDDYQRNPSNAVRSLHCRRMFPYGTGAELIPVNKIDGRVIGSGRPVEWTKNLAKLLHKAVHA